jgi:hypothetical protein
VPTWKWLQVIGLILASLGSALVVFEAGVPWILPTRFRARRDLWVLEGAFVLMLAGMALQLAGTVLSPSN